MVSVAEGHLISSALTKTTGKHLCFGRSPLAAEQTLADNSQQQIHRDKLDNSDTKMIWINVIQRGFGSIFHGDQ
jgi:hypothetical protein